MSSIRTKSLPAAVAAAGGIDAWNAKNPEVASLCTMMEAICQATTVDEALAEVKGLMSLGHNLWAYAYMRKLYNKNSNLYYSVLLADPVTLLPVVYTPTVGEACQKFGKLPYYRRGCFISITDRGNIKNVLAEYAAAELETGPDGKPQCDCIVFTDGARILGLGDLGTWGMGIPIGKLDLYTVCAGVNPNRTIPVVLDAGCTDAEGNTARLVIRESQQYLGLKKDRVYQKSDAGTAVNKAYYGADNMIDEFMTAATDTFGKHVLLQFEDFNSNDAFPLLAEYRKKFLSYNDDIQGTASICIAALLGAIKLKKPALTQLRDALKSEVFLFHGAGSANLGALKLLLEEVGVPRSQLFVTNSRGIIWKSADGSDGSYRNDEQKEFAQVGKPTYDSMNLVETIKQTKATCLVGAVGRSPNCFTKAVIEAMVEVNKPHRPVVFALSNPMTQAEITSEDCYQWSGGTAIYGSGTKMPTVTVGGVARSPAQVNNVYIFPGTSFGAIACQAKSVPESFFLAAAESVAQSLDVDDMRADRVLPNLSRIRHVGLQVAIAVTLEAQRLGLAQRPLGTSKEEVEKSLREMMWVPTGGEDLAKKALEVSSKVGESNAAGASTAAKAQARQLPVDSELNDHLGQNSTVRALKVVIDKKRPRFVESAKLSSSQSLAKDFDGVSGLFKQDEPCSVLIRLKDNDNTLAGAKNIDWVAITYVPSGLKKREEVTWNGAGDSFITNYPEMRIKEWRINRLEDISYFAFMEVAKEVLSITNVLS